ncbi:MAG: thiamine-phosphate kinase [Rhodospirillaceae bacterium]|nr:thiamine-phosphate kinase [Rhodospirillaceae bacterium]
MARLGEFEFIRQLLAPLSQGAPGAFNLTDDAATVTVGHGCELVITKDALVAGVHFFADDAPDLIARKALRVNLSDLAAKGAKPVGFLMALALPDQISDDWLRAFTSGLAQDVTAFACPLVGGDTTATPGPLTISITALGEVKTGHFIRRSGALSGDILCVSGTIGDAALGLDAAKGAYEALSQEHRQYLLDRYRLPQPRLTLGQALANRDSACLDISDGLCADVGHICVQSGVGAVIDTTQIPLSAAAASVLRTTPAALMRVLTGGDDYELALAVPPANIAATQEHGRKVGVAVTPIGRFVEGNGVTVLDGNGQPLTLFSAGYRHR